MSSMVPAVCLLSPPAASPGPDRLLHHFLLPPRSQTVAPPVPNPAGVHETNVRVVRNDPRLIAYSQDEIMVGAAYIYIP